MIKNCFGELSNVLKYVFGLSMLTGIFSDLLKIAKVIPVFKTNDLKEISNYKTKTIPNNIILSKSKYDLKTTYQSKNLLIWT